MTVYGEDEWPFSRTTEVRSGSHYADSGMLANGDTGYAGEAGRLGPALSEDPEPSFSHGYSMEFI
jgi:hypothetical protein